MRMWDGNAKHGCKRDDEWTLRSIVVVTCAVDVLSVIYSDCIFAWVNLK